MQDDEYSKVKTVISRSSGPCNLQQADQKLLEKNSVEDCKRQPDCPEATALRNEAGLSRTRCTLRPEEASPSNGMIEISSVLHQRISLLTELTHQRQIHLYVAAQNRAQ